MIARRRHASDDRGFAAPFTAAVAVALVFLVGVVLDGGRWMRAQSDTFGIAAAAARAGAQEIDEPAALRGELQLDAAAAEQAALAYLDARDLTGVVHVDGLEVTVTAHTVVDLRLLPAGSVDVEETATARATIERST
jgi:hypothetical protein